MNKISNFNLSAIFILVLLINEVLFQYFNSDQIVLNTYSGLVSNEIIFKMLSLKHSYMWLNYLSVPIIFIVQIFSVYLLLKIGLILQSKPSKREELLRIVLIASSIPIIYKIVKTIGLYFHNFKSLNEIANYQPLSLLSINKGVSNIFIYPLSICNIAEVVYCLVLAALVMSLKKDNYWKCLGFVVKTYGAGLLLWVTFVTFIIVSFSV